MDAFHLLLLSIGLAGCHRGLPFYYVDCGYWLYLGEDRVCDEDHLIAQRVWSEEEMQAFQERWGGIPLRFPPDFDSEGVLLIRAFDCPGDGHFVHVDHVDLVEQTLVVEATLTRPRGPEQSPPYVDPIEAFAIIAIPGVEWEEIRVEGRSHKGRYRCPIDPDLRQ